MAMTGSTLHKLFAEGHTYTLTVHVEVILSSATLISVHHHHCQHAINNGRDYYGNIDCRANTVQPITHLQDMLSEFRRLEKALTAMLQPIYLSISELNRCSNSLPSLTDRGYWACSFDQKLTRALQWDFAVSNTSLHHVYAQYLPTYHAVEPFLSAELPSEAEIQACSRGYAKLSQDLEVALWRVHRLAGNIRHFANDAFGRSRKLTNHLHGTLVTLQNHGIVKYQLSERKKAIQALLDARKGIEPEPLVETHMEAVQAAETEKAEAKEGEGKSKPKELRQLSNECLLICHAMKLVAKCLRRLQLHDDRHIDALPTSFLDLMATPRVYDPETNVEGFPSPKESAVAIAQLNELKQAIQILQEHRPLTDFVPARWLLPFLLEAMTYTRGMVFTQVDKFLSGFILQKQMINNAQCEEYKIMQELLNSHSRPDSGSEGNSAGRNGSKERVSDSSIVIMCQRSLSNSDKLKHQFAFKLMPLAREPSSGSNRTLTIDQKEASSDKSAQMSINSAPDSPNQTSICMSDPKPVILLQPHPQQVWPVSAYAVCAKGMVQPIMPNEGQYFVMQQGKRKYNVPYEDFILEEILDFYGAARLEKSQQTDSLGNTVATERISGDANYISVIDLKSRKRVLPDSPQKKRRSISRLLARLRRFELASPKEDISAPPIPEKSESAASSQELLRQAGQRRLLTELWNLRNEYKTSLGILAEIKVEVRCALEGLHTVAQFGSTLRRKELGKNVPDFQGFRAFKDRENCWASIEKRRMKDRADAGFSRM